MRQYIIIGFLYLVAATTFYLFVIQGDHETTSDIDLDEIFEDYPQENEAGDEQESSEEGDSSPKENEAEDDQESNGEGRSSEEEQSEGSQEVLWGVDSASRTTEQLAACVRNHFGEPTFWGRYLEDKEEVSFGLTEKEVTLLHQNGYSILVIYNHFIDGTTYEKGVAEAKVAIEYAKQIGVPNGVAIFANVEPEYPIDSQFIMGWYDTISASDYVPAIYGVFSEDGDVRVAYEEAVREEETIGEEMIIWTNQPQVGITTEANAPDFQPEVPDSRRDVVWQYGLEAEQCNIDTNLLPASVLEYLWQPK
ncbi:glycoside hydrolase domain-containing protein [Halalkalibacter urbisdiaboli]|uniref:glycoside hydrolase domain-containing protein n=1 Tax=Halalkalibacter urbisdiaboli TaxID=1960589 RepID=UPI001FDAB535|nr:glycoside hydrolase domain-containing protein [Halalkalibacter urbisdiaboli]